MYTLVFSHCYFSRKQKNIIALRKKILAIPFRCRSLKYSRWRVRRRNIDQMDRGSWKSTKSFISEVTTSNITFRLIVLGNIYIFRFNKTFLAKDIYETFKTRLRTFRSLWVEWKLLYHSCMELINRPVSIFAAIWILHNREDILKLIALTRVRQVRSYDHYVFIIVPR